MTGHPLLNIKDPLLGKLTLRAAILCVFVTAVMAMIDQPLRSEVAPFGIVSFELATDAASAEAILTRWRENNAIGFAKLSLVVDFVYLVVYGLAFSLLVCWVGRRADALRWTGRVAWWPVWAAICDIVENVLLGIMVINERADEWYSRPAAAFAMAKFAFLVLSLVYVGYAGMRWLGRR